MYLKGIEGLREGGREAGREAGREGGRTEGELWGPFGFEGEEVRRHNGTG